MKNELIKLQTWFEGLNRREQWLVGITFVVAVLVLWEMFIYSPGAAENEAAETEIASLKNRIVNLETAMVPLRLALEQDPDRENKQKIQGLETRLEDLKQSIEASSAYLVTPRQMAHLLEDVLAQNKSLQAIRIQGLPAEPLYAQSADPEDGKERIPLAYRQSLEIEFRGNFDQTLNYLQMVEALPWKYYWQSLVLQTDEYPQANITLRVNTLSLEREWIGG